LKEDLIHQRGIDLREAVWKFLCALKGQDMIAGGKLERRIVDGDGL
jgi:hypothetical protein